MGQAGYGYNVPKVGDFVRDKDVDSPEESVGIVIEVYADTPSCDFYIPALQSTVSDVNPEYPADSPVARVVYANDVEKEIWNWERIDKEELADVVREHGIQAYAFPVPRLDLSASKRRSIEMTDEESSDDSEITRKENANEPTSISSNSNGKFDLSTIPDDLPLDGSGDDQYVRRRSEYLKRVTNLRDPLPKALAYREIGFSSSGIAKKLDTRKQTVEKWLEEIADIYGDSAIETRPQHDPVPELE